MPSTTIGRRPLIFGLFLWPALSACTPAPSAGRGRILYLDEDPDREVFADLGKDSEAEIMGVPAPRDVDVDPALEPGQILVFQERLVIQHIHAPGKAREYPVGLGRAGLEFSGDAVISRKEEWPSWRPTDEMIARNSAKYSKYADGVPGGRNNPLGARALPLPRRGGYLFPHSWHGCAWNHWILCLEWLHPHAQRTCH